MLKPKDISDKRFERSSRGYNIEDVDNFLADVASSYANIYNEYEQSEGKILKLVEKINEYREDEDAIKMAILTAQKQAKQTIYEAEKQGEKIVLEATSKAEQLLIATKEQYSEELGKLESLKREVNCFKAKLTDLYNKQLRLIMEIPEFDEVEDESIQPAEIVEDVEITEESSQTFEDIQENNQQTEPNNKFPFNKDAINSNQSRFGDLRFGTKQK